MEYNIFKKRIWKMRARHTTGSLMDPMHAPTVRSLIFFKCKVKIFFIPVSSPTPWPFLVLWEEEFGSHAFDGTIQRSDEQRRAVDGDWERARWRRSRARRRRSLARRQRNSGVVIWSFQSHSFSFFFFLVSVHSSLVGLFHCFKCRILTESCLVHVGGVHANNG